MKFTKRFLVALCLVMCVASTGLCATQSGGSKKSLWNWVTERAAMKKWPFRLRVVFNADNVLNRIVLRFEGEGNNVERMAIEDTEGIGVQELERLAMGANGWELGKLFAYIEANDIKLLYISDMGFIKNSLDNFAVAANQEGAFGPDLTGMGLLRLGTRYKNFDEVYKAATFINPILYADGNYFSLNFNISEVNTGRDLLTIRCPAPVYRFTNAGRTGEEFTNLAALFYRYARTFGIERGDFTFWGRFASDIWLGTVPKNFRLDGDDSISFGGYDLPVQVEYHALERKTSSSLRGQQREQKEALSKTAQDYIVAYLPYAPLLITVETEAGKLQFLYDNAEKDYRLVKCVLSTPDIWRSYKGVGRELALFVLNQFGDENGIEDMYPLENGRYFYWKDLNRNFVLLIHDRYIEVFPIVGEETLYPIIDGKLVTNAALRKEFEEKRPTTTETKFVSVRPGVMSQQMITRPLTFDEFLRGKIGRDKWEMGFRGFGDSLKLD